MSRPADPPQLRVACAGDAAVVLEFPGGIDEETSVWVTATAQALRERWSAVLRDVVVGYCSVTAYYDPLHVEGAWVEDELQAAAAVARTADSVPRVHEVPVCYGGPYGPDLPAVAAFAACTPDEVVALHTARQYRVYMIGFVPGFAYMASVDPRIAAPRRAEPRAAVPVGAVAIAGEQTGIYPLETPGGWNIIGRSPCRPWDAARAEPSLFRPGDRVQFVRTGPEALSGSA